MTIKGLAPLLRGAKVIFVSYDGYIRKIDLNDVLDMDAYGKYVIRRIAATNNASFELEIATKPISEEVE